MIDMANDAVDKTKGIVVYLTDTDRYMPNLRNQMKKINTKTIKLDYCEKIRELQQMRSQIEKLEDENALLKRQREDMRREKLLQAQAMAAGEDDYTARFRLGVRWGLIAGLLLATGMYTLLIYAATH